MTPRHNWLFSVYLHSRRTVPPLLPRGGQQEGGFILPLVLIALVLGTLLVVPLMAFVSSGLRRASTTTEEEWAYYAADAGIEALLSDLRQGNDALAGSYSIPTVTLNGYTASIAVTAPPREDMLPFGAVFVDPGTATSLNGLPGNTAFLYTVLNVQPRADFQVNWAYTPADGGWQLTVYEGIGTGGVQIANAAGSGSPARFTVDSKFIKGGTYTIKFYNNSATPTVSAPFSTTGEADKTWLRIMAFKDYLITSTAGPITLTVFARQGPGPNQVTSSVHISTWHGPN